jgi:hypothetical protein
MKTKNIYKFLAISKGSSLEEINQAVSKKLLNYFLFNISDIDLAYEAYFILSHSNAKLYYDNLLNDKESEEYKSDYLEQIRLSKLKAHEIETNRGKLFQKHVSENPFIKISISGLIGTLIDIPSGNFGNEESKTAFSILLLVLGCVLIPFFHVLGTIAFFIGVFMKIKVILESLKEDLMRKFIIPKS